LKSLARWGWSIHVVLFQKDSADETGNRLFVGEDADNISTPLDLAIEPLDRIVAVQLRAVLGWEGHVGQHILLGAVHQGSEFWHGRAQLIGDATPLGLCGLWSFLGESGGDECRHDPASALAGMGQRIAHKMNPASLPGGAEHFGDGSFYAFMGIGDHQLHAAQTATGKAA